MGCSGTDGDLRPYDLHPARQVDAKDIQLGAFDNRDTLTVKFRDDVQVRLRDGRLVSVVRPLP